MKITPSCLLYMGFGFSFEEGQIQLCLYLSTEGIMAVVDWRHVAVCKGDDASKHITRRLWSIWKIDIRLTDNVDWMSVSQIIGKTFIIWVAEKEA